MKLFRWPSSIRLWQIMPLLLLAANTAYFLHNWIGWVITLGYFLVAPGFMIIRSLRIKLAFSWAIMGLSIGLSVSAMMIGGLLLNSLYYFGLDAPLQTPYVFTMLDVTSVLLIILARHVRLTLPSLPKSLHKETLLFGALFTILPILSVAGAMRLNNGASNILTMIMLGMIGLLFFVLIKRSDMPGLYSYALLMTSLALLFSTSIRGWYLTGHDIHHELSVFQRTLGENFWQVRPTVSDPYNACLSITILPTILHKITSIPNLYIYKVVFQIIFAFMTPALFSFARRFATNKQALIGMFAFLTFPTYIKDLPFLNRQEMAFMFFILLLIVNFMAIANRIKTVITIILLLSLILSHYSSSYVTVAALLLALGVFKLLERISHRKHQLQIPLLSGPLILMALLAAFIWNSQITVSSSNLTGTITTTFKQIYSPDKSDSNYGHRNILSRGGTISPVVAFNKYTKEKGVSAAVAPFEQSKPTKFGTFISHFISLSSLNAIIHGAVAQTIQIFVLIGTAVLLWRYWKNGSTANELYFLSLCVSFVTALVLFTLLPQLSINYDVTRLLQQALAVLWLPTILTSNLLFSSFKKANLQATTFLFVVMFFHLSGFQPQLLSTNSGSLNLNNAGLYYDFFYSHYSDVLGTAWLAQNRSEKNTVHIDSSAASPLLPYPVVSGLIKGDAPGYYYLDYLNTRRGIYRSFNTGLLEYRNPALTNNKNLIYSNSDSTIYYQSWWSN